MYFMCRLQQSCPWFWPWVIIVIEAFMNIKKMCIWLFLCVCMGGVHLNFYFGILMLSHSYQTHSIQFSNCRLKLQKKILFLMLWFNNLHTQDFIVTHSNITLQIWNKFKPQDLCQTCDQGWRLVIFIIDLSLLLFFTFSVHFLECKI